MIGVEWMSLILLPVKVMGRSTQESMANLVFLLGKILEINKVINQLLEFSMIAWII